MISVLQALLYVFMVVLMLFMLLIILLQRGKGGGLVGAFGGMGGNSAFGAKSSDVFVRITVWTAIIWFVLCIAGGYVFKKTSKGRMLVDEAPAAATETPPAEPGINAAPPLATQSGPARDALPASGTAPAAG